MSEWVFVRRVLIVFAVGALAVALWALSDILLMIFGAVLVAVLLRDLMKPIVRAAGMGEPLALCVVVVLVAGLMAALILPFGPNFVEQTEYLFQQLPVAFRAVAQALELGPIADELKGSAIGGLALKAFTWGSTIFGGAAGVVLVVAGGIYFAAAPQAPSAGTKSSLRHSTMLDTPLRNGCTRSSSRWSSLAR